MLHSKRFVSISFTKSLRLSSSFLSKKDFWDLGAPNSSSSSRGDASPIKLGVNLSKYGVNLSKMAADGQLEQVIGRDHEIQQTIQILSRRRKNNPCLIGEPGVGKTAIAEGLANLIAAGKVPEGMKDKVIISLDISSMIAGTKFRGEFEERMKGIIREVEGLNDRVILFIDELHVIVGAGGSEGAVDASNIMKPSLARGQLRCLGTTTINEYNKYIQKDAALARRFQSVYITEPTIPATIQILQGLKTKYEEHHKVIIPNEVISSTVQLTYKYLPNRKFPDKAIDILDEACSKLRNTLETLPTAHSELEQKIESLQRDLHNMLLFPVSSTESSDTSRNFAQHSQKYDAKHQELWQYVSEKEQLFATWNSRQSYINQLHSLQQEKQQMLKDYQLAIKHATPSEKITSMDGEDNTAVLKIDEKQLALEDLWNRMEDCESKMMKLRKQLHEFPEQSSNADSVNLASKPHSMPSYRDVLTAEDVALIVSQHTGIPLSHMNYNHSDSGGKATTNDQPTALKANIQDSPKEVTTTASKRASSDEAAPQTEESKRKDKELSMVLNMEHQLKEMIVGQDDVIHKICKVIQLSKAGLRFHDRPIGVFFLLGPTGVGKTELAKAISAILFPQHTATSSSSSSSSNAKGNASGPSNTTAGSGGHGSTNSNFLRIDMSEYMEKFSLSRLIGAPPGYVGYDETGILTNAIYHRPYSLILLDEFEKAHKDISAMLLSILDEGRLMDNHQRQIDFRNTVIIMTSNLGSRLFTNPPNALDGDEDDEKKRQELSGKYPHLSSDQLTAMILHQKQQTHHKKQQQLAKQLLSSHFSPEFVNRIDEFCIFNSLTAANLRNICSIQLHKIVGLLQEKQIDLHIEEEEVSGRQTVADVLIASMHTAQHAESDGAEDTGKQRQQQQGIQNYGARPLKRHIQEEILSPIAIQLLAGVIQPHDRLYLTTTHPHNDHTPQTPIIHAKQGYTEVHRFTKQEVLSHSLPHIQQQQQQHHVQLQQESESLAELLFVVHRRTNNNNNNTV